jgi:Rrf2 family iron-sulfur cluster assembly transcriptional regulator
MLDLALHERGGPVQCHDIALRQDIPEPYLNQLLSALRRGQLILSRRGPGGGHQLARPSDDIRLGEIVDALDGPMVTVWPDGDGDSGTSCACALNDVWRDVTESARRVVDRTTLAELADRARQRAPSYSI